MARFLFPDVAGTGALGHDEAVIVSENGLEKPRGTSKYNKMTAGGFSAERAGICGKLKMK